MAIVLSLDVSSRKTGWCCFKHGRFYKREGIDFGIIACSTKAAPAEKLSFFRDSLLDILLTINPDVIAIEDTFAGPNRKTFKVLCRFGGVAMEVCKTELGIEPIIVPVTELRAVWGTQVKKEIFDKVVKRYKIENFTFNKDNDITDAIAIAYYAHRKNIGRIK